MEKRRDRGLEVDIGKQSCDVSPLRIRVIREIRVTRWGNQSAPVDGLGETLQQQ